VTSCRPALARLTAPAPLPLVADSALAVGPDRVAVASGPLRSRGRVAPGVAIARPKASPVAVHASAPPSSARSHRHGRDRNAQRPRCARGGHAPRRPRPDVVRSRPRERPGLAGPTPDRASPARRWRDERGRLRTPEALVARADAPPRVPIVRCAASSRRLAVSPGRGDRAGVPAAARVRSRSRATGRAVSRPRPEWPPAARL